MRSAGVRSGAAVRPETIAGRTYGLSLPIRACEIESEVDPQRGPDGAPRQSYGEISASVVSKSPATEAAFCSASRTTAVGSRMPASIMSKYCPVCASKP